MKLTFKSVPLQRLLESQKMIQKTYGRDSERKIQQQMALLGSAESMQDVFSGPGKWHELTGNRKRQCSGNAGGGLRILIEPVPPVPLREDGGVEWTKIDAVRIVGVEDYH